MRLADRRAGPNRRRRPPPRKSRTRETDDALIGKCFEACGDVDAIAEKVGALDDHIPEIDSYAKTQLPILG